MAEKIEFYQIFYKDEHEKHLFPFAIPYFNRELTPFFENSVIKHLVMDSEADKIGVCSWALRSKMKLALRPLTPEILQEPFDVLSLSRNSKHHQMLRSAEAWHPGFVELLNMIMEEIGWGEACNPKYPVYQNAFVCRTHLYKRYVREFLSPAMAVMSSNEDIRARCWQDSNYTKLKREPLSDSARVQLGVEFYPMHPFICERFFSQWLQRQNLNVKYL